MTVNISKPSINIREKLAELDKPSGIAGEAVLRADSVQEIRNSIGAGRKNLIINGRMDVWQRGASFSAASGYTVDRFRHTNFGGASPTVTKVAGPGDFLNAIRYTNINGSGSQQIEVEHRMEAGDLPQSGNLTLSYWVRGSKSGQVRTGRIINGSTGGANTGYSNVNVTTSWTRVTKTITSRSATAGQYCRLFILDSLLSYFDATSVWLEITGVQLELGSVATDFEHRSYGEELALCQRYYQRFGGAAYVGIASGLSTHLTTSRFTFVNPVQMRTTPSLSFSSLIATDRTIYDLLITNFSGSVLGAASSYLTCTHQSSAIVNKGALLAVRNGTTGYLAFSAEL